MSQTQRIIKYIAVAFAWALIFSIFSTLAVGMIGISYIFSDEEISENLEIVETSGNMTNLDISVSSVHILFQEGDTFKIETNNKGLKVQENNDKLEIEEKGLNIFKNKKVSNLVITIPTDFVFDKIYLESGAGKVIIEDLSVKDLSLDLGAGKVEIDSLTVLSELDVDGGAGNILIKDSKINNLDLDMGVGEIEITSKLTGDSKIDAGVGKIKCRLIGTEDDYRIRLEKGVGNVTIQEEKATGGTIKYGNGNSYLEIDGGVGNIDIKFETEA